MRSLHVFYGVCYALLMLNACNCAVETHSTGAVQVTDAGREVAHLTVAADASRQRVYVAWTTYPSDDEGVNFLAISHDGGHSFGEPMPLPGRTADHPVLRVAHDGTLFLSRGPGVIPRNVCRLMMRFPSRRRKCSCAPRMAARHLRRRALSRMIASLPRQATL